MLTEETSSVITESAMWIEQEKEVDFIRYQLNDTIVDKAEFAERTAVINLETGDYYSIWGDKARNVFKAVCQGANVVEIMEAFGPYSFVSVAEMKIDLQKFIQQFVDSGMLIPQKNVSDTKRTLAPLLYAYLLIEKHQPTQEKITIRSIENDQIVEVNYTSKTIYEHLENSVVRLIDQNFQTFETIPYKVDNLHFTVAYSHSNLKEFFHPVIALNEVEIAQGDSLQVVVSQVDEVTYVKLRDLLNANIEQGKENFSFTKNGLEYQLEQVNSEALRKLVYWWDGTIQFYNKFSNTAYYICQDVHAIPKWEQCFSFRDLLNWHTQDAHLQFLHGAGLYWKGKGVLLTAEGGSGKSTTTLYAIKAGIKTLGDDFLVVNTKEKSLHSIYSIAKFRPGAFEQLAEKEQLIAESTYYEHNQKYHLNLAKTFSNALIKTANLDYILIPIISGKSTAKFVKATQRDALKAILLSTLYLLPGNKKVMAEKIKKLVQTIPIYFFYLSNDLNENPKALKAFLTKEERVLE